MTQNMDMMEKKQNQKTIQEETNPNLDMQILLQIILIMKMIQKMKAQQHILNQI